METLRLWPTAPAFAVQPREDTLLGGRYAVTPADALLVLIPTLHRDPSVWGDDVERFRPDRFAPEARQPAAAECLEAVRQRRTRLHRPRLRDAGGAARPQR